MLSSFLLGSGDFKSASSGIYVRISYNTGTRALPDIYALALGCCSPLGIVCIYHAKYSCLCYNLYLSPTKLVHLFVFVWRETLLFSAVNRC